MDEFYRMKLRAMFLQATLCNSAREIQQQLFYLVFAKDGWFSFGLIHAFKSHFSEGFPTSLA